MLKVKKWSFWSLKTFKIQNPTRPGCWTAQIRCPTWSEPSWSAKWKCQSAEHWSWWPNLLVVAEKCNFYLKRNFSFFNLSKNKIKRLKSIKLQK